ncbi:hypothetical protein [Bhargavaea cecembensis]|uniref:hypothetical protein n=1 Tax=Bhargavaea cecembensis TaxID=394098 RepID=UPI00058FE726|nr:hypothetical protein [Bhargavaea cecembensis]
MARYEFRIRGSSAGWAGGKWRLVERRDGPGGCRIVREGSTPLGKMASLPVGPFLLSDVVIDFEEGRLGFDRRAGDPEHFFEFGPDLMSSYVVDFGGERYGFFVDGSRRPDKKDPAGE